MKFDKKRRCPKCDGHANYAFDLDHYFGHELMLRKCQQCGYAWEEQPLDAKEPKGTALESMEEINVKD